MKLSETTQPKEEALVTENDSNSDPQEGLKERVVSLLQAWPGIIKIYILDPEKTLKALPIKGSWEPVLTYAVTSGVLQGFVLAGSLYKFVGLGALRHVLNGIVMGVVGVFIAGIIVHGVMLIFKKKAGFYRSSFLMAQLSFVGPAVAVLGLVSSVVSLVGQVWVLYILFLFARLRCNLSAQKSAAFVALLIVAGLVSLAVLSGGMFLQRF